MKLENCGDASSFDTTVAIGRDTNCDDVNDGVDVDVPWSFPPIPLQHTHAVSLTALNADRLCVELEDELSILTEWMESSRIPCILAGRVSLKETNRVKREVKVEKFKVDYSHTCPYNTGTVLCCCGESMTSDDQITNQVVATTNGCLDTGPILGQFELHTGSTTLHGYAITLR